MATPTQRVVLVTGGNSGVGFHACLELAKRDNMHIILTGYNAERVAAAVQQVQAVAAPTSSVEAGILDLNSLKAVQEFAEQLLSRNLVVDTLLCNAGVHMTEKKLTTDGLEATFGVNHLGHFFLVKLLRESTRRIVVISSIVHDPAAKASVPPPNISDFGQLAFGNGNFDGSETYSNSKLCNLLFMNELLRRYPEGPECIAYTPGFTPDTGLARHGGTDIDAVVAYLTKIGMRVSTAAYSGAFMARLCVEDWAAAGWKNGMFINSREKRPRSLRISLWPWSSGRNPRSSSSANWELNLERRTSFSKIYKRCRIIVYIKLYNDNHACSSIMCDGLI